MVTTEKKYVCRDCGYVYDPALGDESMGIPKGVPFDALPPDWRCSICGVGKGDFVPW
ncbi:MAG: rubredoxin [Nitrospirae bacterium]|nr:rubredoxin [Nitrospirota bacterium]